MRIRSIGRLAALFAPALLLGCRPESGPTALRITAMSFASSDWSPPVNMGTVINSSSNEQNAVLARDGLSLYLSSNRPGTSGPLDIWVSQRACTDGDDPACAWQTPVNLGAPVNGPGADFAPNLSGDGHLLFFASNRGSGLTDIYVSHRANPNDDFGWEDPAPLGAGVNTSLQEQAPMYLQDAQDGSANLYFNRGALALNQADFYVASVTRDGTTLGPAQLVVELSEPTANDAAITIRADGREALFWSGRAGGLGGNDLWVSTRPSIHDPWSPPVDAGATLNSKFDDVTPSLSTDGRTLIFASNRPGGHGGNDLYMSTRTPSGH